MDEQIPLADKDDEVNVPIDVIPETEAAETENEGPLAPKKPGIVKRFLAFLFDTETSFGRFNKSFLRLLVSVLVLFTAGVLVTYFVLYQPVKAQLADTTDTLITTTAQLTDTQKTLDEVTAALKDMTTAYDDLAEDFAYTTVQNQLLRVYGLVVDGQGYIQDKNYVEAKKMLASARELLDDALPEMKKADKEDAERLDSRLDLVISEFGNDVKAAESDLKVMVDWILEFDKLLQDKIDK